MTDGRVGFFATDTTHGTELWVTDGTTLGTSVLVSTVPNVARDPDVGRPAAYPNFFTPLGNGRVVFDGVDDIHGRELWVTDGTEFGTYMVKDINPGPFSYVHFQGFAGGSNPAGFTVIGNGRALFSADDGVDNRLWVTDGTKAGTSMVSDIKPALPRGTSHGFTPIGSGRALFSGYDGTGHVALWITDGTAAGTSLVKDTNPGHSASVPRYMTDIGNGLALFDGVDSAHGGELWITNGTETGTSMIRDIDPDTTKVYFSPSYTFYGPASSNPKYFVPLGNGRVVFEASIGGGKELFVTDGTYANTRTLSTPSNGLFNPIFITSLGSGKAVFQGSGNSGGTPGLWVTDGTDVGTYSINSAVIPENGFVAIGDGKALFHGLGQGTQGLTWITDGTAAGTRIWDSDPIAAFAVWGSFYVACFRQGTRIATPQGNVAVEALSVGDSLLLANGDIATAKWIGFRDVDARRHPEPRDVWPVRIAPHAFGVTKPSRALFLSPDHAVSICDILIPVRYLINGATIEQVPVDKVQYYHIELERHGILLAEGLSVESYLDTGNRSAFTNGGSSVQMHPEFALSVWESEACAPIVSDGEQLDFVRQFLLQRAAELGHFLTFEPDVRLVVGSTVLKPDITGPVHCFSLPASSCGIRLLSRFAIPAHVRADSRDYRQLGIAVSRVLVDGTSIALSDARLSSGWHDVECERNEPVWRWTDGDAGLALAGVRLLEIEIVMTGPYWREWPKISEQEGVRAF